MIGKNSVVRQFLYNGFALEAELRAALRAVNPEQASYILSSQEILEPFLDQILVSHRTRARFMAQYYELFFLIENFMRDVIREGLSTDEQGEAVTGWWESKVPQVIQDAVKKVRQREIDAASTPRASDPIHYTTFGELAEIAKANWDIFGQTFNSTRAFEKCMTSLNTLRGPIAHCSVLAEDEVVRLYVAVRDLFRVMS